MNRDYAKRALDFLADMIRFKSYSGTPGEGELARFVVERMQRLGLEAFTQEVKPRRMNAIGIWHGRSEEHTSELQSQSNLVCRLLLEKKKPPRSRVALSA